MNMIHCDYCGNDFNPGDEIPDNCPNCLSPLNFAAEEEKTNNNLELVCQKNGASIALKITESTVLGRTAAGKEILGGIPQISRNHCRIDPKEDGLHITDLNSTNGTFLGSGKIDCKMQPDQLLEDGQILYLGREPFLIQLSRIKRQQPTTGRFSVTVDSTTTATPPETASKADINENAQKEPTGYECACCRGYISPTPGFTCPKCRTWNE